MCFRPPDCSAFSKRPFGKPTDPRSRGLAGKHRWRINDFELVTQIFTSWNRMVSWLSQLQGLRRAA